MGGLFRLEQSSYPEHTFLSRKNKERTTPGVDQRSLKLGEARDNYVNDVSFHRYSSVRLIFLCLIMIYAPLVTGFVLSR